MMQQIDRAHVCLYSSVFNSVPFSFSSQASRRQQYIMALALSYGSCVLLVFRATVLAFLAIHAFYRPIDMLLVFLSSCVQCSIYIVVLFDLFGS